jgi:RecA-family ATPase
VETNWGTGRPALTKAQQLYRNPLDGSTLRGLPMLSPVTWAGKDVPERKWIVDRLIPSGSVTMLNGDGGLGKSLLVLQLMTCCAAGKKWLGHDTAEVKSMGIFCEDEMDEIHIRMTSVVEHYDVGLDALGEMRILSRVGFDNTLMESRMQFEHGERRENLEETQFYHQIYNTAADWGAQLVVLDSLHDLFAGNENDRRHARYFVGMLRRLALDIEGAVIINAHPSLSGMTNGSGTSGSTAWNAAVRSRLYLTKTPGSDEDSEDDADRRVLKTMKANYGKHGGKIELKWENGVFVVASSGGGGGVVDQIQQRNDEKLFLDALLVLKEQNRPSSDSPQAGSYLPKLLKSIPLTKKFGKQKLQSMMMDLLGRGVIAKGKIGVGGDRHALLGYLPVAPKEEQK